MNSLSFLIPAYNDEATIATQVKEAAKIGKTLRIPFEILVINDASQDGTGRVLGTLKKPIRELRVITHKKNLGYGASIKELYYSARKAWLFTIPGDYQVPAKELLKLTPHLGEADMLLGWRTTRNDTKERLRQSRVYNTLVEFLFRLGTHDVNSVRLMRTAIMEHVSLAGSSAFVDAELIIKAKREGFSVREISIVHNARKTGTGNGGGGKIATILPTIWEMLKCSVGLL